MLKAMWKGSLSFGLVNIPVQLFTASESKNIKFRYLHAECHTPVEYRKFCPSCGREVSREEMARGYEYGKEQFVLLTEEEIKAAAGERERLIEIQDFVEMKEIDPIYFQNSYYLGPDGPGKKPYSLLLRTMQEMGKIGLATVVLRSKETLAALRVYGNILALSTMFYPDEVRSSESVEALLPSTADLKEGELEVARELIERLTVSFEPGKYRDRYRENLLQVIEARYEGKEVVAPPAPDREKVVDLLEALQASVEKVKENEDKARGKKKKAPSKKATGSAGRGG